MSTNTNETEIPSGAYDCWAVTDADNGMAVHPIQADRDGWAQIKITIALAEKGSNEAFTTADVYQVIDPDAPARGGVDTTPYEFAVQCLLALGAESREAIIDALYEGLTGSDQVVTVRGVGAEGKKADAKVSYKPRTNGAGSFMNVQIFGRREVSEDARTKLADKFKRMKEGGHSSAAPFAPRGQAVSPPPGRGNPFAPRGT